MADYRFEELGGNYQKGKILAKWRPQWQPIINQVKEGSKVLDIGCGDGVLGEMLIDQKGCVVYGTDLDKFAVAEAKRKGIKAQVHDANLRLPFKGKSFDYVICNEVLEYLTDIETTVYECLRVGKKVIIEFPNFGFWFYRLEMLLGSFPKKALFSYTPFNTLTIKFFSLTDFMKLRVLQNAKVEKIICINWRNRKVSIMAKFFPNFFGRSCILILKSN